MITDFVLRNITLPEKIIRREVRKQHLERIQQENIRIQRNPDAKSDFIASMNQSPIFLSTETANEQHYEVPADFFKEVLGCHLKYSSGFWEKADCLNDAEEAALKLTCDNAEIQNGEEILELGCGWGSLTLYMAEKFPDCKITAVSNSQSQKKHILEMATQNNLDNIEVITENVGVLSLNRRFDRVVSVEMFEHARNYRALLEKVSSWLKPKGKLFVHIFVHRDFLYSFNPGESWMADYFFKDGLMPSYDIFTHFPNYFKVSHHTSVDGTHYQKTAEAWHENHLANKKTILKIFSNVYGERDKLKYWNYWRIFFIACSELFGWNRGKEWLVGHYLLEKSS